MIIFAGEKSFDMTQEEKVAYWLDLADYDIET